MPCLSTTRRLIAIAALVALATQPVRADPGRLLQRHAPRFVRTSVDGRRIDLVGYRGKVVLLTFWATWCTPCRAEMPCFIDLQARFASHGLQILAVSMDDDPEPVRALAAERKVNYPVLMGDARLGRAYGGILGLPINFLIDRHGRVAAVIKGESDLDAMESTLRALLDSR